MTIMDFGVSNSPAKKAMRAVGRLKLIYVPKTQKKASPMTYNIPRTIEIYLPVVTVSISNVREHWAKRANRAKLHRQLAYIMAKGLKGCALPVTIKLTRISPRKLDDDNLRGALKSVRDGIADRLGIDDRDPRVIWEYAQTKGHPKEHGVLILGEPAHDKSSQQR
jgi:hypothetical protein